jgi:DNA polymerase
MLTWEILEKQCRDCQRCALSETRTNTVFGVGSRNARLMFIGEAPGQVEDQTGEPFTGPAGQLLDDMLAMIGLSRKTVYIANTVKCRPPGNRDPLPDEMDRCRELLRGQVSLIRPQLIVCLGRIAAARIIDADFKITRQRGQLIQRGDYWLMATFHPSFLLRDAARRPEAFEDFMSIERKLAELPAR